MRKYMYLYYYQGQMVGVATHRLDRCGCKCGEYTNITPSSEHRLTVLANQPYTVVDSWDNGDYHTVEVDSSTWKLPQVMFSMFKNDVTCGTGPLITSIDKYSVIRTLWVKIDRQGNRSAEFTKVVEGIGCLLYHQYDHISFSSFLRFMKLTLDWEYYIIPGESTVTFVVQTEDIR